MNHRKNERGLSLVEVVLALGLMGAVLISVAGLFVLSQKQVVSGKTASEALAVGRHILEEMNGWSFRQTYQVYGFDGTATTYTVDSRTNAYAGKWQTLLDDSLERDSFATIRIDTLGPGTTTPTLAVTKAMKVTVTVNWSEGDRDRNVQVATVRM